MSTLLYTAIGAGITLDHMNYIIALGIILFIYMIELYCIYLDRHKQTPSYDGSESDYKKYYGRIPGLSIYWLNKGITYLYGRFGFFEEKIPTGKHNPFIMIGIMILTLVDYCYKIVIAGFIISLMLFKNIFFKLICSKLLPMTIVTGICWVLYNNYITKQDLLFSRIQIPTMLVNIFGSSVYKDIIFNDIQTSHIVNDANIGKTSYVYKLKDYYINACNKPYIIGGADSSSTTIALQYIINAGARYMTFDIFEDSISTDGPSPDSTDSDKTGVELYNSLFYPNVRSLYVSPDDGIPFIDMIKALANTKPFSHNPAYPLILQFNFLTQTADKKITSGFKYKYTYDIIHDTLLEYFGDRYGLSGSTEFGFRGIRSNNSSLSDIPIQLCYGKVLVVSNNVYQYNGIDKGLSDYTSKYNDYIRLQDSLMPSIIPYIYATINIHIDTSHISRLEKLSPPSVDPGILIHHYTRDQLSEGITGGKEATTITSYINSNKTGMRIVTPDDCVDSRQFKKQHLLRDNGFNPRVLDLMNAGAQVILMNYQYMGQEIENYLQIFSKTSFVLKPEVLREMPPRSVVVNKQSPLVSFAPKSFSLKGVIDEPIIF